jgi:predicted nucleic acid-binding protein
VIVLDACVLIAHLDESDIFHEDSDTLLGSVADEPLGASAITLAEVLVGPARAGRLDQATAALAQLEVAAIALGADAPARLATLRAGTSLKLPDCCVLLAAEQKGGAAVATFDDRLASAALNRGFRVLGSLPRRESP